MVNYAVEVHPWEHIEETLKRYKKAAAKSSVLADIRRHEEFLPKGLRRREKALRARRRARK